MAAYLRRFGYLSDETFPIELPIKVAEGRPSRFSLTEFRSRLEPSNRPRTEASLLQAGVALFQLRHQLKVTGEIDGRLLGRMVVPRCGLSDDDDVGAAAACPISNRTVTYAVVLPLHLESSRAQFELAVERAWKTWSGLVEGLSATLAPPGATTYSFEWISVPCKDGYLTSKLLAHADFPGECGKVFIPAPSVLPIHFRDFEDGKSGSWGLAESSKYDVESVALHEIGHYLGMKHIALPDHVMYEHYAIGEARRTPGEYDKRTIERLYPKNKK